ncbi:MAG: periplasmic heavy metal sensor [Candidatus Syntrophosphaera sp.]|nr:periplasmic heavy metal sensor [Candidatus Syntrophosphaera sp.]
MSKRLMTILLLVSLALNAGIIGGLLVMGIFRQNHLIHHSWNRPESNYPRERDRDYSRVYEDPEIKALRDAFNSTKKELMQELAKDPVDEARIHAIIERSVSAQSDMEQALGMRLLELRKTISAEEAKAHFTERLERIERINKRIQDRRN